MGELQALITELEELSDSERAEHHLRFFKTAPGQYGEGDRFRGMKLPVVRKLARKYRDLSLEELRRLMSSEWHEDRQVALFIMVKRFETGNADERDAIYGLYLDCLEGVNNWDLVDGSAPQIIGGYLENRPREILYDWAREGHLWERRIAMLATFHFIRRLDFSDTLALADILLLDDHDLMHKAVGWMLREVGNRDRATEEDFLQGRYSRMPRTMLRYAIEKFPEDLRQDYLKGRI